MNKINLQNLKIHILRSALNLPAMLLGFAALAMLPLEKMTAIHFIVPIIVTIVAVIFLKEKIEIKVIIGAFITIIGTLILLSTQKKIGGGNYLGDFIIFLGMM